MAVTVPACPECIPTGCNCHQIIVTDIFQRSSVGAREGGRSRWKGNWGVGVVISRQGGRVG
eukprot:748999-Hanusia_phi.AAC.2